VRTRPEAATWPDGSAGNCDTMFLQLRNITKRFGSVTAVRAASLDVEKGSFVCFVGPSGCGKTTLLRIIAGLEEPDTGELVLDGTDLSTIPARLRNFGVVFQSYSLFPNMSVRDNVGYGLECRRWKREAVAERAHQMLSLVQLTDQAAKFPHQLSGGQQQRVALARALAPEPAVLLLDEPLSALDAKVREDLRGEIKGLQNELGITTVMVTHDQDEAMEMADRIVVLDSGVVQQVGSAADLYSAPTNRFVAEFIGRMNVLEVGNGAGSTLSRYVPPTARNGKACFIGVRPEHIELTDDSADAEGHVIACEIERHVFLGNVSRVVLRVDGQKLLVELRGAGSTLDPGTKLNVKIPLGAVHYLGEAKP
jgi:iron(III) transport system ATP-binding protein